MSILIRDANRQPVQTFKLPNTSGVFDTVAVGATSSANAGGPLAAGIYYMCSTVDCHVVQSENGSIPTATASHTFIPAYTPVYFYVNSGQRIAAIAPAGGAAGTLYLARMP